MNDQAVLYVVCVRDTTQLAGKKLQSSAAPTFRPLPPSYSSDIVDWCLERDPKRRPSALELLRNRGIKQARMNDSDKAKSRSDLSATWRQNASSMTGLSKTADDIPSREWESLVFAKWVGDN